MGRGEFGWDLQELVLQAGAGCGAGMEEASLAGQAHLCPQSAAGAQSPVCTSPAARGCSSESQQLFAIPL